MTLGYCLRNRLNAPGAIPARGDCACSWRPGWQGSLESLFAVLLAASRSWASVAIRRRAAAFVHDSALIGSDYARGPQCGDANRGMILYGQAPTAGLPRAWACNQCHSTGPGNPPTPLTDSHTRGMPPEPVLIRAAPRDPGYIQVMMHAQPEVAPVIAAMEACLIQGTTTPCLADRPPNNVMGDLGDIAEFLYTCDLGLAPCVAGGGTGGGGGGPTQGELQASGTLDFGNQAVGIGQCSAYADPDQCRQRHRQRLGRHEQQPGRVRDHREQLHRPLAVDIVRHHRHLHSHGDRRAQRCRDRDEQRPIQPASVHLRRNGYSGKRREPRGPVVEPQRGSAGASISSTRAT